MLQVLSKEESEKRDFATWQNMKSGDLLSFYLKADETASLDATWVAPKKRFALITKRIYGGQAFIQELNMSNRELALEGQPMVISVLYLVNISCIDIL